MTAHTATPPALPLAATGPLGLAAVYELTKPRITRLVAITSSVGFTVVAVGQHWRAGELIVHAFGCVIGTMLSASGANALNQWWERDRDALMPRTCARPLPQARVTPRAALAWGLGFSALGVGTLALIGAAPAMVALATILLYVLVYTPLKPITTLNTIVGAIPGALPPLIGWSAASTNGLQSLTEPGGWSLVILMVIWQIPHFLAIAWMYREDYARGGYKMLPLLDPSGRTTSRTILVWAIALVPATVAPWWLMPDRLSPVYAVVAVVAGVWFIRLCLRLRGSCTVVDARRVFIASIIHLPVLLMVMVADAVVGVWVRR